MTRWTRQAARQTLGLTDESPVLLVFGGSKGARSINNAVLANLPALLEMAQVIHITGELDWPVVEAKMKDTCRQANLPVTTPSHTCTKRWVPPWLLLTWRSHRAGASTLGEYPLFGLPAILVPYPHAWRYQKVNAEYLVSTRSGSHA